MSHIKDVAKAIVDQHCPEWDENRRRATRKLAENLTLGNPAGLLNRCVSSKKVGECSADNDSVWIPIERFANVAEDPDEGHD
jgi:hypothetical protein